MNMEARVLELLVFSQWRADLAASLSEYTGACR